MKLALKLTIAVMLVMTILLLIHSILVVDREVELFEKDMERHANIVGNAILAIVPDFLQIDGSIRLADIIKRVNEVEPFLHIRLVDFRESSPDFPELRLNTTELKRLQDGHEVMTKGDSEKDNEFLYAYFPISIKNYEYHAIEVAESMTPMRKYILNTISRKIILFIAVVLLGGLLVLWLGARIIGASVNNMVQLTKRVSDGNYEELVSVKNKNDEMSKLAEGLNGMVVNLRKARERLEEETSKKMKAIASYFSAGFEMSHSIAAAHARVIALDVSHAMLTLAK